MIAFLGFCSQAANTGVGPLENLKAHIADPVHNNSEPPSHLPIMYIRLLKSDGNSISPCIM